LLTVAIDEGRLCRKAMMIKILPPRRLRRGPTGAARNIGVRKAI
jgi:hypothetical protein